MPTTTPPSSEAIELPDCSRFPEDVTSDDLVDLLDSKEIIRALAEGGFEAAKAILEARAHADPALAQRIAELRERVRRQAERNVSRTLGEYDRRIVELETVGRKGSAEIATEIAALEERRRRARSLDLSNLDPGLLEDVRSALILPDQPWMHPPPPPGFLDRLRALFARLVAWFRGLFGRRKAAPAPVRRDRTIAFATLSAGGRTIGRSELGDALAQLSGGEREELSRSVDRGYQSRERELQRSAEEKRKEAEAQRRALEAERAEAERRAQQTSDRRVREAEEHRLERELKERGFVAERGGELQVTFGLIERFARLVLEEESRQLPSDVRLSLTGSASTGVYEKARLRRSEEIAHLDLPGSLLAARLEGSRHIDETTSYVFREITSERVHVVLVFDKSGSMSESEKLPAAKKALLALYVAIRKRHPQATIDVVAFDNEVRVLDLLELWECTPGAFTNTAEALHTAHMLLAASRATRKEVYLVTDGLPESVHRPRRAGPLRPARRRHGPRPRTGPGARHGDPAQVHDDPPALRAPRIRGGGPRDHPDGRRVPGGNRPRTAGRRAPNPMGRRHRDDQAARGIGSPGTRPGPFRTGEAEAPQGRPPDGRLTRTSPADLPFLSKRTLICRSPVFRPGP